MTIQRLSIVFAALGLGLIGLSAQPTPQPGVQPPVVVYPSSGVTGSGTVTATQLLVPNGTVGAPSIAWASDPTTGLYRAVAGQLTFSSAGAAIWTSYSGGFVQNSAAVLGFEAGAIGTAIDTQITRGAAGSISIGSTPNTFATLGTPSNGAITYCTDCTVTTAATCPGTQASCVCAASGNGAFARRVNGAWYCTF